MTTSLFLIRHAETMWNREGRMQGFQDSPLSETGTLQSEALGTRLKDMRIDAYYSSDAARCVRTMRIATGSLNAPVTLMPELRERNLGGWESLLWTDIVAKDSDGAAHYKQTADFRPPQGETLLELRNRMVTALVEIEAAHRGKRVAVFTSGGSVRAAVFGLLNLPADAWAKLAAWNTGITRLDFRDGVWKLLTFNDVSHLKL